MYKFIILILLFPQTIHTSLHSRFIIWNVGQGAWATLIEHNHCLHFDMGGESTPLFKITQICKKKKNSLYLTHLDWDHINKIKLFQNQVHSFCLHKHPELNTKNRASLWLKSVKQCQDTNRKSIKIRHRPKSSLSKNQSSLIYTLNNKILITGDSPISEEKKWVYKVPKKIKILILGHHGSKTSTSHLLVKSLKINVAIASARKRRFGHPHKTVLKRLKKFKIPALSTQDWGNIHFEM